MKSLQLCYVPFFKHNDPTRMQMASSHIRQAVNLVNSEMPKVKSHDCPKISHIKAKVVDTLWDGVIVEKDGVYDFIQLDSFLYESYVLYTIHEDYIEPEGVAADGTPLLGVNLLTVVMPFGGYNYEDAIVISETAARKLAHWSWEKEDYVLDDNWSLLPCINEVDEYGIPKFDLQFVKKGDPYIRLLKGSILNIEERIADKDYHLLWDFAVTKAAPIPQFNAFLKKWRSRFNFSEMSFALRRRLSEKKDYDVLICKISQEEAVLGDKLANRHGNKGVIGLILPDNEMPMTPYGPAEIVINPLGIISRMNIGQLFEIHLTKLARDAINLGNTKVINALKEKINFDPETETMIDTVSWSEMKALFQELGKRPVENVYDPIAQCTKEATVGWCYWMKLHHLAKTKYSCRQFSGRKGQRFGEMETWTLIAYGAENLLYEMFSKLTDSPQKYQLFSQLFHFEAPLHHVRMQKSVPALKFEYFMKVLGIDIDAAYRHHKDKDVSLTTKRFAVGG